MKVMQILPSLNVGGVERGVIDLARAMKHRGEETVVISSGGELLPELQKIGVVHYELPVHKKSLFSLRLVSKIAEIIRREGIELVHARSRVPAWLAWFATRQTGTPFVTTCHGYYSTHLLSRIMGWGKRVIVISRIVGRHMIDDFGVLPDRIRLIHRGVDLSHFDESGEKPKKETQTLRILNVGRFSPIKGQVEFLKSIHLLRSTLQNIEVWLVGEEGKGKHKYTDLIKQTIDQLGLNSCVKLLGTRRDIPDLLKQSDLLVLSTLVPEAFGRVVIEAGAMRRPVLATRVGGVLDIIDHDVHGCLVPPGDPEAMSEGMFKLLTEPEYAANLATQLQKKVKEEFSLERMTQKVLDVYHEALSEKKILIMKLSAMGDVILAVPSLRMIRERYPDAYLALMVDKKFAPFVSNVPYINEIIPVDRKRLSKLLYLLKVTKKIRNEGFDISIDLQNSKWTHLIAFLANVKERFGFARGKFGFLLNRPDRSHDKVESPVDNQFRILSKLGVREMDDRLELRSDPAAETRVREWFKEQWAGQDHDAIVGFVVGSSPKWPTKRWPYHYYQELGRKLESEANCRIVLIGSQADAEDIRGLTLPEVEPSKRTLNLLGKTSPQELVAVIQELDVVVSGDTAPLHIANAVGTSTIALFGPTDPKRHVQVNKNTQVLCKNLECQPCYEGTCHYQEKLACLKKISVDEVFQAVMKKIEKERVSG